MYIKTVVDCMWNHCLRGHFYDFRVIQFAAPKLGHRPRTSRVSYIAHTFLRRGLTVHSEETRKTLQYVTRQICHRTVSSARRRHGAKAPPRFRDYETNEKSTLCRQVTLGVRSRSVVDENPWRNGCKGCVAPSTSCCFSECVETRAGLLWSVVSAALLTRGFALDGAV